jgi:hypothetical protein
MSTAQHWNNILSYVKLNLGVPVNVLEISDDELVLYLKDHVLPLFSQYVPHKKYAYITSQHQITGEVAGSPQFMYRIPVTEGTYIIDILEAYPTKEISVSDIYTGSMINAKAAMDVVISNAYIDAIRSMQTRLTWEFLPPDIMIFDMEIAACVVVYNTTHEILNTVRPDLYHKVFKPLCLGHVKLWVAAMRSKYENLSTPFGPINLNFETLKNEGQTLIDNCIGVLDTIPPDILIEVS